MKNTAKAPAKVSFKTWQEKIKLARQAREQSMPVLDREFDGFDTLPMREAVERRGWNVRNAF